MKIIGAPARRKTGRPLSFDRETALEQAMLAFWRHGYETTSVADLTAAMGISAPSLYAAFGDKRRLFLEAMHRYAGDPADLERRLAAARTARDAVHDMLVSAAMAFTGEATPRGCLLASATASGSDASADVRLEVSGVRRRITACVVARIDRDIAAGLLPGSTDARAITDLVLAVVQGMSVLARDDVPRQRLLALAEQAILAWPDHHPAGDHRVRKRRR